MQLILDPTKPFAMIIRLGIPDEFRERGLLGDHLRFFFFRIPVNSLEGMYPVTAVPPGKRRTAGGVFVEGENGSRLADRIGPLCGLGCVYAGVRGRLVGVPNILREGTPISTEPYYDAAFA